MVHLHMPLLANWYDHSRDLLHMVNHFRDEIPRPIVGIAHSMGCAQMSVTHLLITPHHIFFILKPQKEQKAFYKDFIYDQLGKPSLT